MIKIIKVINSLIGKQFYFLLLIALVSGVFESIGIISLPVLFRLLLDEDDIGSDFGENLSFLSDIFDSLSHTLLFILFTYSLKALLLYFKHYYQTYLFANLKMNMRLKIVSKFSRSNNNESKNLSKGEILNLISSETERLEKLATNLFESAQSFLLFFLFLAAAFMSQPLFSAVVVLLGGLTTLFTRRNNKKIEAYSKEISQKMDTLHLHLNEFLESYKFIKILGAENTLVERMSKEAKNLASVEKAVGKKTALIFSTREPLNLIILFVGLMIVVEMSGAKSLLLASVLLIYKSVTYFGNIQKYWSKYLSTSNARIKINTVLNGFMDEKRKVFPAQKIKGISVESLYFSYSNTPLYRDMNVQINMGEIVVVSGKSGSGKSTLIRLLTGDLIPDGGSVRYVDDNGKEYSTAEHYLNVGFVPQVPFLYTGSVFDNVTMWDSWNDANEKRCVECLKRSGLYDDLLDRGLNLKSNVKQFDDVLSGGQRQRLNIARSIYNESAIVVLDEPTSALDADSRDLILSLIMSLSENRIIILITHDELLMKVASKKICL